MLFRSENWTHDAIMAAAQVDQKLGDATADINNNNNEEGTNKTPGPQCKSRNAAVHAKNYEKYSLRPRSIQNRIEVEKRRVEEKPKKGNAKPKPKSKPPPLSKYRRKTANARERDRMKDINAAFEQLQKSVPSYPILPTNSQGKTCEKLTKITTLKLAMNYIQALSDMLNGASETVPAVGTGESTLMEIETSSPTVEVPCAAAATALAPASEGPPIIPGLQPTQPPSTPAAVATIPQFPVLTATQYRQTASPSSGVGSCSSSASNKIGRAHV